MNVSPTVLSDDCNFGRSLLAGYCEHYMSDFALHGTGDKSFLPDKANPALPSVLGRDLKIAVQVGVISL